MEISVDTFLKKQPRDASETVGRTTMTIEEAAYLQLEALEQSLKEGSSSATARFSISAPSTRWAAVIAPSFWTMSTS